MVALGEHFWGHFGPKFRKRRDYVDFWVPFFWSLQKAPKRSSQGGGHMRSAHARACFVRVGPLRFGSILGSILESFGLPNLSYTSFGPPIVRNQCHNNWGSLQSRRKWAAALCRKRTSKATPARTGSFRCPGGGQQEGAKRTQEPYHTPGDPRRGRRI